MASSAVSNEVRADQFTVLVLDGKDVPWSYWSERLIVALQRNGVGDHIERDIPTPEDPEPLEANSDSSAYMVFRSQKEEISKIKRDKGVAYGIIYYACDRTNAGMIKTMKSKPYQAWAELKAYHVKADLPNLIRLNDAYNRCYMLENESVASYCNQLCDAEDQVFDAQEASCEENETINRPTIAAQVSMILSRLSPRYAPFVSTIKIVGIEKIKVNDLWSSLLRQEDDFVAARAPQKLAYQTEHSSINKVTNETSPCH